MSKMGHTCNNCGTTFTTPQGLGAHKRGKRCRDGSLIGKENTNGDLVGLFNSAWDGLLREKEKAEHRVVEIQQQIDNLLEKVNIKMEMESIPK